MKKFFLAVVAAAFIMSGCTKTTDYQGTGKLIVKLTDDPFNISFVESATVTITKIELRKAGLLDSNKFIVVSEDKLTLDLLTLRNGITEDLPAIDLPQGSYDLVRLYVEEAGLKIKDQPENYNVKIPSGKQTGIKIFISPALHIEGGLTSELLLDFDLSRSFVMRGNLSHSAGVKGFIFKPCIRATNNSTAGRIEGLVTDTLKVKINEAKVWVEKDTVMATAYTDTLGHYAFIGVPAGTYSVFATKADYDTVSFSGVKVSEANRTILNFDLTKK
ncbi:MAG: DUF4382 domain-containing protein [Bacteroidales bacterium]|nr:DUF4382 domain-containing protein [Bacteroidales bacterium]